MYFISRSFSAAQLPLKNLNDNAVQQPPISTINDSVDKAIEKAELDAKKSGRITKDDILDIIQKIKKQSITPLELVKCLVLDLCMFIQKLLQLLRACCSFGVVEILCLKNHQFQEQN